MGIRELAQHIGRRGLLNIEKLAVEVECLDVKEAFGRVDCLVTPIKGVGQQWVSESRIAWEKA